MPDKKLILVINRPSDNKNLGTGIASTYLWLKKKLLENGEFEILDCKPIANIPNYKTIASVLVYDYLNPLFLALKYRFLGLNPEHIFFPDVAQTFFISLWAFLFPKSKITVLIQDCFFLVYNNTYDKYIRILYGQTLRHASEIICTSEETRQEILDYYPKAPPITVCPLGMTIQKQTQASPQERQQFGQKLNLLPNSRALNLGYIGSSGARKRLDRLLALTKKSLEAGFAINLLLAGPISAEWKDKFSALNGEKNGENFALSFLGSITEEEKIYFYETINLFVFPTELEGFGLPILESWFYKKPCLVFESAKIPQLLKKDSLTLRDDLQDLEPILTAVLGQKQGSSKLQSYLDKNFLYSQQFDWSPYLNYFQKSS